MKTSRDPLAADLAAVARSIARLERRVGPEGRRRRPRSSRPTTPRAAGPRESQVVAEILALDLPGVTLCRTNAGMVFGSYTSKRTGKTKRWVIRVGAKGMSDLVGFRTEYHPIWQDGKYPRRPDDETVARFLAIEVKRPPRQATAQQQEFLDRVNAAGGIGFVAWSAEDVRRRLSDVAPV